MDRSTNIGYEVLRSLRRILRKVSEHSRSLAQTTGLTVPQLLCLRAVERLSGASDAGPRAEAPDVTLVMIARQVRLSNATVSRILDRLERAGFLTRERRAADRRKVCVSLTTLGRERLKNLPQPLHDQFLRRVEALDEAEREDLLRSLDRIVDMMEAQDIDASPVLTPEHEVDRPPGE